MNVDDDVSFEDEVFSVDENDIEKGKNLFKEGIVMSKKEYKKFVKEVNRERRQNKIFKYVKKRKEKLVKIKRGRNN